MNRVTVANLVLEPKETHVKLPLFADPGLRIDVLRKEKPVDVFTARGELLVRLEGDTTHVTLVNRLNPFLVWFNRYFHKNIQNWEVSRE
jgi:hypothetical protein